MSDQDSMTREQLEAAGYVFKEVTHSDVDVAAPDGWSFWVGKLYHTKDNTLAMTEALQAATSHYRQRQELFNFREFLHDIDGLLDKLSFYGSNYDALDDLQILRDSIDIPNTWHGDAGTWEPPTVSKTERAE